MVLKLIADHSSADPGRAAANRIMAYASVDNDILLHRLPALNVFKDDERYMVELAVPGRCGADFTITTDNQLLTISADEGLEETDVNDTGRYMYKEYGYTAFSRSLELPADAIVEAMQAKYIDGELVIHIPRSG